MQECEPMRRSSADLLPYLLTVTEHEPDVDGDLRKWKSVASNGCLNDSSIASASASNLRLHPFAFVQVKKSLSKAGSFLSVASWQSTDFQCKLCLLDVPKSMEYRMASCPCYFCREVSQNQ
jgi:hypothetical protein